MRPPHGLAARRALLGLSIRDVRRKSGLSMPTIVAIEHGNDVLPSSWRRYCEALGYKPLTLARELEPAS